MKQLVPFFTPYRSWLHSEFSIRQERNSAYSLRAFARDLAISKTCISDLLNCRRHLSTRSAKQVAKKLQMENHVMEVFLRDVESYNRASTEGTNELTVDTLKSIYPWYYFALLSLARIKDVAFDPLRIGERLGLNAEVVSKAIEDLIQLRLLVVQSGKIRRVGPNLKTGSKVPQGREFIKQHHRQFLELGLQTLADIPPERWHYRTTTMAVNKEQLPRAIKLIEELHEKVDTLLTEGEASEVYTLCVQLFPLTKVTNNSQEILNKEPPKPKKARLVPTDSSDSLSIEA